MVPSKEALLGLLRDPKNLDDETRHFARLEPTYLDGPADLVVEIVSPESVGRDRGEKFYEYEEAGIPEYWLLDPQVKRAEFYQLGEAAQYQLATLDEVGRYRSREVAGFWLKVAWLWQEPLPPTDEALMEIGGQAYAERMVRKLRQRGLLGRQ